MDFNLPEELQRRICFALIPAKTLCWPPKLSHYHSSGGLDERSENMIFNDECEHGSRSRVRARRSSITKSMMKAFPKFE
jgi:hypothetical protein